MLTLSKNENLNQEILVSNYSKKSLESRKNSSNEGSV